MFDVLLRGLTRQKWLEHKWKHLVFGRNAQDYFILVTQAYETLSNANDRQTHDDALKQCEGNLLQADFAADPFRWIRSPSLLFADAAKTLRGLGQGRPLLTTIASAFQHVAQYINAHGSVRFPLTVLIHLSPHACPLSDPPRRRLCRSG